MSGCSSSDIKCIPSLFDCFLLRLDESCSHKGAILFKIEAAVRLGCNKQAYTDVACKWNNDFVKKIEGKEIGDIIFYKTKTCRKKPVLDVSESEQEHRLFLQKLKQIPVKRLPVALSLFKDYSEPFVFTKPVPSNPKIPNCLREFYKPNISKEEILENKQKIMDIKLTEEQADFIENATKQQSNSLLWKAMRIGRIIASIVYDVLYTNIDKPSASVIKTICTPGKQLIVPAIKWGQENEPVALKAYEAIMKNNHEDLKIIKSGLKLSTQYHYLGASTDAIAICQCDGKFLIKIKCPSKHREKKNIQGCITDDSFCINSELQLKSNRRYMYQVQMQMFIHDTRTCNFVIWTPNFCFPVIVEFDDNFLDQIKMLKMFFRKHLAHELVTRNLENDYANTVKAAVVDAPIYCYCKKEYTENDKMIGCDNENCKYQWIHFTCAKLKHPPKGV